MIMQKNTTWQRHLFLGLVLSGLCVLGMMSFGAVAAQAPTPVGKVLTAEGRIWGRTQQGIEYGKIKGDYIGGGEIIGTGSKSAMTMRFIDSTTLALGADAQLTIDELVFDPKSGGENDQAVYRLSQGAFYFVSGMVAKDKVQIITPTATVGIRGTELAILVDETGATQVGVVSGRAYMRTRDREGRERTVEIGTGFTSRATRDGKISKPFKGVDLTGDAKIDRRVPGAKKWLDDQNEDEQNDRVKNRREDEDEDSRGFDDEEDVGGNDDTKDRADDSEDRREDEQDSEDEQEKADGEDSGDGEDGQDSEDSGDDNGEDAGDSEDSKDESDDKNDGEDSNDGEKSGDGDSGDGGDNGDNGEGDGDGEGDDHPIDEDEDKKDEEDKPRKKKGDKRS